MTRRTTVILSARKFVLSPKLELFHVLQIFENGYLIIALLQIVANEMGVGDLYGLFACIVTRRSWKSVTQGIDKSNMDSSEVSIFFLIVLSNF